MKRTLSFTLAAVIGLAALARAEDFDTELFRTAALKGSQEGAAGVPLPLRPVLKPGPQPLGTDIRNSSGGGSSGGGDLGVVARAVNGGCRRVFSILVYKTGIKYMASGDVLADQAIAGGDGNIGHTWIRLVDKTGGTDEYHGHTGELGQDEPNYSQAIRILNGYTVTGSVMELDPEFADEDNPALYLQHVYTDGKDHGGDPGHTPNFEAAFCVSQEQFKRAEDYVMAYDFKHYGGFSAGCGYFVLGVFNAAGLGFIDPRFSHDLPSEVYAYGFPIRLLTPGTANYDRARTISCVYPDAIADQLGKVREQAGLYYRSK